MLRHALRVCYNATYRSDCHLVFALKSKYWVCSQSVFSVMGAARLVLDQPFRERCRDLEFPPAVPGWLFDKISLS
jgi:hypothetical protein